MLTILDGVIEKAIAVEISDKYTAENEKELEKMFDEKISEGHEKINFLVKINDLSLSKSSWKAIWNDGMYALKHLKNCGRIAVVGDSKIEAFLVKVDNAIFGSKKSGRLEKFFYVIDLDKAFDFVNEKD